MPVVLRGLVRIIWIFSQFLVFVSFHTQAIAELLNHKADPNIQNNDRNTPLSIAEQRNSTAMVVLIEAAIQNLK